MSVSYVGNVYSLHYLRDLRDEVRSVLVVLVEVVANIAIEVDECCGYRLVPAQVNQVST